MVDVSLVRAGDNGEGEDISWTRAIGVALERYAADRALKDALSPLVEAIEGLIPGWRAFVWRHKSTDDEGVPVGPELDPGRCEALSRAVLSANQASRAGFFECGRGPNGDDRRILVAPLMISDHHVVGVLALTPRAGNRHAEPGALKGPVLILARLVALMVDDSLALEASRSRESILSSVLETMPDALVRISVEGEILSFNRAAETMFGWSESEMLGGDISRLMPEPHASRHQDYVKRYLATGERRLNNWRRRFQAVRRDGGRFPVEIAIADVKVDDELSFVGILRDMSDRIAEENRINALREAAENAARLSALGEMAATIAHEVNQPLTAIGNYIDAATARLASGGSQEETLALLARAREMTETGGEIVLRVKRLTRKGRPERAPVDINDAVEEALSHLDPVARRMAAVIERRFDPASPVAMADRIQIQQVMTNLARNGLDAVSNSAERRVTVTTRAHEDRIEITVDDSGPGIPKSHKNSVFQSFVTTREEGVGLGLAVSRRIVKNHGGEIDVENLPGGGAQFRVQLPMDGEAKKRAGDGPAHAFEQ